MFSHVMIGSNDLDKARTFYDATLGALGIDKSPTEYSMLVYKNGSGMFGVGKPRDGKSATHANGGTIGFAAPTRAAVDAFHKAALANGGTCEGPPGPRDYVPNAYGAYVRDLDGHKLCTFCYAPA